MMIRAFFAIDLPPSIKNSVETIMVNLNKQLKPQSVRWVKPEQLHITLQFLKKINKNDIPEVLKKIHPIIKPIRPFEITLGKIELFPTDHKSNIISMSVTSNDTLSAFSTALGEGITQFGYPIETRPFRAHLTLGRINPTQKRNFKLPDTQHPPLETISVTEIVLFQSEPRASRSRFTPLEKIYLK